EAAAQPSVFLRALSGPTCSTLLYARLRASSDIVIQSMVGHSFAPRVVGVATQAAVVAMKARRSSDVILISLLFYITAATYPIGCLAERAPGTLRLSPNTVKLRVTASASNADLTRSELG